MILIDKDALYERTCSLEAQALDYVGKLIERDGDEASTEWKIWSAILVERTAFKHDLFDAPTIEERKKGKWRRRLVDCGFNADWHCSRCGWKTSLEEHGYNFCPNCGADMRQEGEDNG